MEVVLESSRQLSTELPEHAVFGEYLVAVWEAASLYQCVGHISAHWEELGDLVRDLEEMDNTISHKYLPFLPPLPKLSIVLRNVSFHQGREDGSWT